MSRGTEPRAAAQHATLAIVGFRRVPVDGRVHVVELPANSAQLRPSPDPAPGPPRYRPDCRPPTAPRARTPGPRGRRSAPLPVVRCPVCEMRSVRRQPPAHRRRRNLSDRERLAVAAGTGIDLLRTELSQGGGHRLTAYVRRWILGARRARCASENCFLLFPGLLRCAIVATSLPSGIGSVTAHATLVLTVALASCQLSGPGREDAADSLCGFSVESGRPP